MYMILALSTIMNYFSHGNKSGGISVASSDRKQALESCMQVLDPFSILATALTTDDVIICNGGKTKPHTQNYLLC